MSPTPAPSVGCLNSYSILSHLSSVNEPSDPSLVNTTVSFVRHSQTDYISSLRIGLTGWLAPPPSSRAHPRLADLHFEHRPVGPSNLSKSNPVSRFIVRANGWFSAQLRDMQSLRSMARASSPECSRACRIIPFPIHTIHPHD